MCLIQINDHDDDDDDDDSVTYAETCFRITATMTREPPSISTVPPM